MKNLKYFLGVFLLFINVYLSFSQKVGVVDTGYILTKIPEYIEAEKRMNNQVENWIKEIEALQAEYETKREALEHERILLIGDHLKQREKEVEDLARKIKEETQIKFTADGEMNKHRVRMMRPFQDQIWNAIKIVSEKNNLGIVIDKSSGIDIIFLNERFDYTDKVLETILSIERGKMREKEREERERQREEKRKKIQELVTKDGEVKQDTDTESKKQKFEKESVNLQAREEERKREIQRKVQELINRERGINRK